MKDIRTVNSIYDLAKETGVSSATVSKVLNGNGRISAKTRRLVLDAAESFNFKPRQKARRTTIAMIVNNIAFQTHDAYHMAMSNCIVKEFVARESSVEFYSCENLSRMRKTLLDGVICLQWSGNDEGVISSLPASMPKVLVNQYGPESCSLVIGDHIQSGRLPAEQFFKSGHRMVGFIINGMSTPANAERARSFRERFSEEGIELPPRLFCDLMELSLLDAVERILKAGATAIYLAVSGQTNAFASILRRLGVKVPSDLSVIAMEEWGITEFQDPPYSAIQIPMEAIAARGVELLLHKIEEGDSFPERIVIQNTFIERDSIANPRGGSR